MSGAFSWANRRVLITGGAGFIGSNLALRLVKEQAEVTLVDSLIPEYGGNLENLKGCGDRVTLNISDVRDQHSLRYLLRDTEIVFNLAGQTSHMDSMADPFTDLEINGVAQLSLLETCRKVNPKIRIVFASTRQIYGRPDYLPVDEKHPLRPVDVNGINKIAGESYHTLYHDVYGIPTTSLRLTNTIGPRMRIKDARQTFVGIWIRKLLEGKAIEVWGGSQLRDLLYVDDAVEAFLLSASMPGSSGKVFNVGASERISLLELAESLVQIHGSGDIEVREYPSDRKKIDIGDYCTDATKIREVLGWEPRTPIRSALEQTMSYYEKHFSSYL